jgi:hypothetical protein
MAEQLQTHELTWHHLSNKYDNLLYEWPAGPSRSTPCRQVLAHSERVAVMVAETFGISSFTYPSVLQRKRMALAGRTVLVTGSTDGIGRYTAMKLAQSGAKVLVHGRYTHFK